ncbi:pyridine nucleotide-disulfide oxidoreductase [Mycolicibacterium mageritense DSM 44476 = CIP 104973]|uniref:Pyridine nucleotide-disulfide oxidoreductase n=1 Tax=Mycolicibacterium mageritense TaxID=53462 RepID=A0ABM7HWT6_MYCME|nr:FAD-dependent oxidoreductase [Mycolicibacterium mageritense]MCC9183219.1 FAD-dependent oxidoreductase [Mycolicibacterium mageritense]BBX35038.1 pyridine nucleotide-disulfide oxidoreductase [Mycolicibacterium mageritense]CDO20446.1 pyridine nucleotide-disulfide oxidoreductase [Mycolicibacterium mageritense DSM 44476 = CIP 104973]
MTGRTFVTVGAGQTAAVAARTLRRRGFDGRIVLIGDEPHAPYQRPPLSKEFLSGADTSDSLEILPPQWRADNDIELLTGTEVVRVDTAAGRVELARGPAIDADAVLFATGGQPRRLSVPGPRPDLVHYLRTVDDARRLQAALVPGRRLAIIGAGFIGLEIAATASTLGVDVTVLEVAAVPLAGVVGPRVGAEIARVHRDRGVSVRAGVAVDALHTTVDGVVVTCADGTSVAADAVVVGIGITPNTAVAAASGLSVDGGIVVDAQGRTSIPNIYAAGDVASRYSARAGRHVRLEHFDNANRQGAAVANAMLGREAVNDDAPWFWSDQFDHNLQLLGAATTELVVRGDVESFDFSAFYLDGDVLRGVFTVDRGEDVMAGRELLGRRVERAVLEDEDTDLWELVDTEEVAS